VTQLDIFAHRFGDETHPGALRADGDNSLGDAGVRMLDAVQTVVDVLVDENGNGYRVGFADFDSAMTDHKQKRIIISGKPLTGAKRGTSYRDIAAILTGFAVHEVGHTKKVGILDAVKVEWPGKKLPFTIGNIIEDIVLEARTIEQYAGFADIFDDAFDWVADKTCPKYPISWGGSSHDKVNFAGQVARYRRYTSFAGDARSQEELLWWEDWTRAITSKMTPKQGVEHVKAALLRIAAPVEQGEEEGENPMPPEGPVCDGPTGPANDDDEEPTDEKPPKGKGGESEPTDEDGEDGEPGDGEAEDEDEDGEDEGGTEGGDDESEDGEGGDETEPGEGKGDGGDKSGDNVADTTDRRDGGKGSTDGPGKGGSGQTIAEASDPADFDESKVNDSFDDAAGKSVSENYVLQKAVNEERTTARLDGGIHGKMRVIFQ